MGAVTLVLALGLVPVPCSAEATPEQVEFFEKRVRPVLAANCLACHGKAVNPPMGGVRLDSRDERLRSDPDGSRLLRALSYQGAVKTA